MRAAPPPLVHPRESWSGLPSPGAARHPLPVGEGFEISDFKFVTAETRSRSVFCRLLHTIDYDNIELRFRGFQFQADVFNRTKERRHGSVRLLIR